MQGVAVHAREALPGEVESGLGGGRAAGLFRLEHARGFLQLLDLARERRLHAHVLLVAAHRVRDLREVAGARGRHHRRLVRAVAHGHLRQPALAQAQAQFGQARLECLVQGGHAVVVEARGVGAEDRHLLGAAAEGFAIALHLLGDVAQRVGRSLAVELVDGDELGEVQHVDLFELAGRAELGRHHVERHVHVRHDRGVALADAGGLDDHEIEAGDLAGGDDVGQRGGDFAAEVARGQRAHVDPRALRPRRDRVHADAVAEQGAPALAARGVDGDDGDVEANRPGRCAGARISWSVSEDLPAPPVPVTPTTGMRRLAASARTACSSCASAVPFSSAVISCASARQPCSVWPCQGAPISRSGAKGTGSQVHVAAHDHVVDHALQAHLLPVLGRVDARDAVGVQVGDLLGDDHAAATPEYLDVAAVALPQQIERVLEVLDVAALVGADGNALHVLLQRRGDHLVHRAVVARGG